eukprot:1358705-Alexandrium_andersonii.AAC.1
MLFGRVVAPVTVAASGGASGCAATMDSACGPKTRAVATVVRIRCRAWCWDCAGSLGCLLYTSDAADDM